MGMIKKSKTLFFTTSPRSPKKLIPEIELLIREFEGMRWSANEELQKAFASVLAEATTFQGDTSKKYSAFSARDRITRSPQCLGLVDLVPVIRLTEAGNEFIHGPWPHEVFLRQLIKYQLPSPYQKETRKNKGTFWCHPFLEIMRLIKELEYVTPDEFRIYVLQLTDYRKFEEIKQKILWFRGEKRRRAGQYKLFVKEISEKEISLIYESEIAEGDIATRESDKIDLKHFIRTEIQNSHDYSDACFRYLRYTEMFLSDGKSIRIAPEKMVELEYILSTTERDPVFVDDMAKYKEYLFCAGKPTLYSDIKENIVNVLMRNFSFTRRELAGKTVAELKTLRDKVIQARRTAVLQQQENDLKSYALYQEVIDTFNEIVSDEVYDAPLFLEWNTWRAMTMLDGGAIKGNFKMDDMGRPISTAQGNMPDIECDYDTFALSVEVTLQRGQRQYETEGEPVTRHYAQLLQRTGKETYCLFIAPIVNRATWAHFFGLNQIRNIAAYGGTPKIVPLELDQFMKLVETSYSYKGTTAPSDVEHFLKCAIAEIRNSRDENDWKERVQSCVDKWLVA